MTAIAHNYKNTHDIKLFVTASIALHIFIVAFFAVGYLFSSTPKPAYGEESIKAMMIDLSQTAAPELNLVENSQDIQGLQDAPIIEQQVLENVKQETQEEDTPDLVIAKEKIVNVVEEPKQLVIKDKPKIKKEKQKHKSMVQKSSKKMVKQDVIVDKKADVAVASSIANNNKYSSIPKAISRTPPEYPRRAIDMRIEGYVIVNYDVNENGKIENIRIIEAHPNNIFNRAVIKTMHHWKYQEIAAKDLTLRFTFKFNQGAVITDQ
ncbi:TonB family protein [Orbaceae bacterium ac157xtp]